MSLTQSAIEGRKTLRERVGVSKVMNRSDCLWLLSAMSDGKVWDVAACMAETQFDAHHADNVLQLLVGYGVATTAEHGYRITEAGQAILAQLPGNRPSLQR